VKAGMIEVASGHVPGHLREAEPFWESSKWKLTKSGSGASIASLTGIILQDPPLEIAADEARDVAGACGGCEPDDPRCDAVPARRRPNWLESDTKNAHLLANGSRRRYPGMSSTS
jgi:hypothetical protein